MEWPGRERCPAVSRIANNSETMRWIAILRPHYVLQLLILSTGTRFQRVSEHYMVTRTFLSILTLERGPASTSAQYNSMEYGPTQGFLPVHLVKGILWWYITTHGPGIVDPPPLPPKGQKIPLPTFLAQTKPPPTQAGKNSLVKKLHPPIPHPPPNMYLT